MRRTNLLLVGLLTAVGLVAGCGGDSGNETAGTVTVTAAGEVVTETVTVQAEPVLAQPPHPHTIYAGEAVALEPAQQTKQGVTMLLTGLTVAPGWTRVHVSVANDTDKTCFFSDYDAVLIADGESDKYGSTNHGSTDLRALERHAAVGVSYDWQREIPADTSAVRVVARCHCGSFTHGRHLLFDIETRLRGRSGDERGRTLGR